jgi:CRISPR-associated endonuclease Csn1
MKVLGLDIGTNSIGWALIDDTKEEIIAMGVRIFPVGVNEDKYNKSHVEESKNKSRRDARSARRRRFRQKMRRIELKKILTSLAIPAEIKSTNIEAYQLRAKAIDEKVSLADLGLIFLHLNKRRGFKSTRKDEILQEGDEDLGIKADKEAGKVKVSIEKLQTDIKNAGCRTMGEYFYSLIKQSSEQEKYAYNPQMPIERIRGRYTSRKLYGEEFDMIWNKQKEFYPNLLNAENYKNIKEKCIFYQRELKSQKHLINKCRFEKDKPCCPTSKPIYQEFRIWQKINDLIVSTAITDEGRPLTKGEKQILFDELQSKPSLKASEIKKLLFAKPKSVEINFDDKNSIKGNITRVKLIKALGEEYVNALSAEKLDQVWHYLHIQKDKNWLKKTALEKLQLTEQQAFAFAKINLEDDYGSLCSKAMGKILPHLKEGYQYSEACKKAGYHHSLDTEKANRPLEDSLKKLKANELRNPIVQRSLTEMKRLVNEVIGLYGKPDLVRVETARELRKPKEEREKMHNKNRDKDALRKEYADFLSQKLGEQISPRSSQITKYELWLELGADAEDLAKKGGNMEEFVKFSRRVSTGDKTKFNLWKECLRRSVYTGEIISLSDLFKSEIEVEHIIPYSKSMDNGFTNKTLCERKFNQDKGGRTPHEYIFDTFGKEAWNAFCERIKVFPKHKQDKLKMQEYPPADFLEQQLRNTAYIALKAGEMLAKVVKVELVKGQSTAQLRAHWGLNGALNRENPEIKNRGDHRHHAVDAVVIALTTKSLLDTLSKWNAYNPQRDLYQIDEKYLPKQIWGGKLRTQLDKHLEGMLISHRADNRLIVRKKGRIFTKSKGVFKTKTTFAVRGALHEETLYGKIIFPHKNHPHFKEGDAIYVVRKKLSAFKEVKELREIIDLKVLEVLKARVDTFSGKIKEAFKGAEQGEIKMYSPTGKDVAIQKVRIGRNFSEPILLRPKENKKLFVESGNNYILGIYENPVSKERKFKVVKFFDAVRLKAAGKPVLQNSLDDFRLIHKLKKGDMFIMVNEHEDEVLNMDKKALFKNLYKVIKFSQGKIYLGLHYVAKFGDDDENNSTAQENDRVQVRIYRNALKFRAVKVKIDILGRISMA